jgi:putative copper export protein
MSETRNVARRTLEDRLDDVGWGLLFLLFAALVLPNDVAEYVSVAAVGALMLGLNVARRAVGVRVGWFSIVLGAVALISGVGAIAGLEIDAFALFFALLGVVLITGAAVRSRGSG